MPRWTGSTPKAAPIGRRMGNHHHDRRKNVHQAADNEQKEVERQQKRPLRLDRCFDPLDQKCRHLGINQIPGEAQCGSKDQQDGTDKKTAFGHDAREIPGNFQIAIHEGFYDKRIQCRDGRGFHGRCVTAEKGDDRNHREQHFPFCLPQRVPRLRQAENRA